MKIVMSILIVLCFQTIGLGQNVEQGDGLFSPHIGVAKEGGDPASRDFPMLLASYEYFISDMISLGALVGYESATLENPFSEDEDRRRYYVAGIGNVHFIQTDALDGYGTVKLGYEGSNSEISNGQVLIDLGGGLRYFVSESFAVFGEVGLGYSPVRVGASFAF